MSSSEHNISRSLIKSMLVIGSAQVGKILISVIRMKVLAILLGPSGIGLLSIYNSLKETVTRAAGIGMASSGVREIASARGNEATLSKVRRVLFAAHLVQGAVAMFAVWFLREQIASWLFGDAARATEVGLIGVAILMTLLATAQTTLLQGLRRVDDLARVTVWGAFVGTLFGLAAIWALGESGLIWFVIVQPLVAVLIALNYTRHLPKPSALPLSPTDLWEIWKPMAKLGAAFMLGGLATVVTLLMVRGRISQELGFDAAGHFAAAWGITMTYVGFLLGAMSADYYPRLTEVIHDRTAATRLINDQVQLGLAIGGPVLLLLIGLAPWLITLLYSREFEPAIILLQWQTLGNVFKLASWPLSFAIVAAGRPIFHIVAQLSFNVIFLGLVVFFLPTVGLLITAIAFLLGYIFYFLVVFLFAKHITGFRWKPLSFGLLILHISLATALLGLALAAPLAAAGASPFLACATGLFGLRVVLTKIGPNGRIAVRIARFFAMIGWPIRSNE